MVKTMGFLLGSGLTLLGLLWLQGSDPRLTLSESAASLVGTLTPASSPSLVAEPLDKPPVERNPPQIRSRQNPTTTAANAPYPPPGPMPAPAAAPSPAASTRTTPAPLDGAPTHGSYRFWSPFRSRLAARGFARRLSSATGVPIQVAPGGDGYRVEFDYTDNDERRRRLQQIETVTGLELD